MKSRAAYGTGRGAAPKFAEATVAALIAKLLAPLVTANLAPAEPDTPKGFVSSTKLPRSLLLSFMGWVPAHRDERNPADCNFFVSSSVFTQVVSAFPIEMRTLEDDKL
ncbi:MAG: hypothetical protein DME21_05155 [Verrucomicrobia bacterium]|nr:MAG: hypothetical protein DME21_05155 [Verrucomicrobiota bacterium]